MSPFIHVSVLTQQLIGDIQSGLLRNLTTIDKLQLKKEAMARMQQTLEVRKEKVRFCCCLGAET